MINDIPERRMLSLNFEKDQTKFESQLFYLVYEVGDVI